MISQTFLDQLEVGLQKSFNRAGRPTQTPVGMPQSVISIPMREVQNRSNFMKKFMESFREHNSILQKEIQNGGHSNHEQILTQLNRQVEQQLSTLLFRTSHLDEKIFNTFVWKAKQEVRSLFYTNYHGSK